MLSFTENIPNILRAVKETGAKKILDIGPGMGKFALLLREQEISDKAESGIRYPRSDLKIDCYELNRYFRDSPILRLLYNQISLVDFRETSPIGYDLIMMIDVIEHYPKEEIHFFLSGLKTPVLISTPKETVMYKDHYYGDPHHHCSQWTMSDFSGYTVRDYSSPLSHIAILQTRT